MSSAKFSPLELSKMFGDCDVGIWLHTTFIFNPFINLFVISESLFAMCPSDNFFNQEAFLSLLIETKLAFGADAKNNIGKIKVGNRVSVEEYISQADMDEFYCVCLLILSRIDCRRKIRFIQIGDCYSVTSEETMIRLFNVMYCGSENSSAKLADCETDTINLIRKEYLKFSCEYGAKYKSIIILNFDSVECFTLKIKKKIEINKLTNNLLPLDNDINNRLAALADIPRSLRQGVVVAELLPTILMSVAPEQRLNLSVSLLHFFKCSALQITLPANDIHSKDLCDHHHNEILKNRIRIFKFNPEDITLWISGLYFSTYYKQHSFPLSNYHVSSKHNAHRDTFMRDGYLILNFNSVCQPVAPVDSENEFYALIYACVVADALTKILFPHNNSTEPNLTRFKKLCCVIPVYFDLRTEYWLQIACFLNNVAKLLNLIGTIPYNNAAFCNSENQPFSFDMVVSFPGSVAQTPTTNYSFLDEKTGVQCGDILIVNPFSFDLFFWLPDKPNKELLVLSRFSFMQISGGLKFGLCGNNSCETMVYFKSLILPESKRCNRQCKRKNDQLFPLIIPFKSTSENALAVIRFHLFDDAMIPNPTGTVISVPICPYKCANFLCCNQERDCYFHYPYCDTCLLVHMKLERKYINKVEGYGLFTKVPIKEGHSIICENITSSFYELISANELKTRYGSFAMENANSVPYVNEIELPDGMRVYLDQTLKRGVSSLLNMASTHQIGESVLPTANCVMHFEAGEHGILLKITTTKSVEMNEELRFHDETGRSGMVTLSNSFGVVEKMGKYYVDYDNI
jgi:hypothetical protein